MNNFVITIARGYGSGGTYVAKELSKLFGGIKIYDKEILEMASERSGIAREYFYALNDKIADSKFIFSDKTGIYKGRVVGPESSNYLSDENIFSIQAEIVKELAEKENCIILGKAANYILKDYDNAFSVNVQSDHEYSIKTVVERIVVDEYEAERLIEKHDRYRSHYYKYFTGRDWKNPLDYDLIINISYMSEKTAALLIKTLIDNEHRNN